MLAKCASKTARNRLDEDPDIYMGVRMPIAGVRYYALLNQANRTCPWRPPGIHVHDEGLESSPPSYRRNPAAGSRPRRQSGGLDEDEIEKGDHVAA